MLRNICDSELWTIKWSWFSGTRTGRPSVVIAREFTAGVLLAKCVGLVRTIDIGIATVLELVEADADKNSEKHSIIHTCVPPKDVDQYCTMLLTQPGKQS